MLGPGMGAPGTMQGMPPLGMMAGPGGMMGQMGQMGMGQMTMGAATQGIIHGQGMQVRCARASAGVVQRCVRVLCTCGCW